MKKYTLIIILSLICCMRSNAQSIEKVKTLYFIFGNQEYPAVSSDSVIISKISNDTTWFKTSVSYPTGQGFYYKAGQKVYKKEATRDILLYDYSLVAGDSIVIHTNAAIHDTFKVDSVYFKKLNHRTFKAWHLTVRHYAGGNKYLEWIEGFGELRRGWDTKHYYFSDGGWETKGMCLNDSIIFWDTAYNYFKDRNPSPSCMFDSLSKRLSINQPVSNDIFKLFPNPATHVINIISESEGVMQIVDYTGKVLVENLSITAGNQTIDIAALKPGIYLFSVQSSQVVLCKRVCVKNN